MRLSNNQKTLQNGLHQYFCKQYENIETHLTILIEKTENGSGEDAVRQLRLSTKKTRALFRLIQPISRKQFNAKQRLISLRKLFKSAGELRDTQLLLQLLEQYETENKTKYPVFRKFISKKNQSGSKGFEVSLAEFDRKELEENKKVVPEFLLEKLSAEEVESRTIAELEKKLSSIRKLLAKLTVERLHDIRIIFKEAFYIARLVNECGYDSKDIKKKLKSFKIFARKIGAWHDKTILQEELHRFFEESKQSQFKKYFALRDKVKAEIEAKKDSLADDLRTKICPKFEAMIHFFRNPIQTSVTEAKKEKLPN